MYKLQMPQLLLTWACSADSDAHAFFNEFYVNYVCDIVRNIRPLGGLIKKDKLVEFSGGKLVVADVSTASAAIIKAWLIIIMAVNVSNNQFSSREFD